MKISERQLRKLILEEIREYLYEGASLCHNEKGHFAKCEDGNTYSLSAKGAKAANVDKKYVSRGTVTSDKRKKDGTVKMRAKFGVNSSDKKSGGRIKMPSGEEIPPRYSVSKYPEKYEEQKGQEYDPNWPSAIKRRRDDSIQKPNRKSWFHGYDEMSKLARGVGLGLKEDSQFTGQELIDIIMEVFPDDPLEEAAQSQRDVCRSLGLMTVGEAQKQILGALNAFALAQDGKLNAPRDKQ
jgi:hypothetical protein